MTDCQDCDPKALPIPTKRVDQAQPASKANMSVSPIASTLSGPSAKTVAQEATSGESASQQQEEPIRAPQGKVTPSVLIEFCDRCRWAPRATWIQTELFLTFPTPAIKSIALIPLNAPETGGRFRVWLDRGHGEGDELVWDRKTEGGFPELKILKQRIRNLIQPDMPLGHSDKPGTTGPQ